MEKVTQDTNTTFGKINARLGSTLFIGLNVIQKHFSKSPILHQQIEVTSVFKCQHCQITSENYSDIIEHIANTHEMENSNFDAKSILETRQVSNKKDDAFKEFRRLVSIGDLPKS